MKMKVAVCIQKSMLGGSTTSAMLIYEGLIRKGFDARIITTSTGKGDRHEKSTTTDYPIENVCLGESSFRSSFDKLQTHLSNYDVIINNHSFLTTLVIPTLPLRIIRISTIRTTNPPSLIEDSISQNKYLDYLVGISPKVCDLLRERNVKTNIAMIPNSVPYADNQLVNLSSPLQLLFVGRLEQESKNIAILPQILDTINNMGIPATLTIAGDGADRSILEKAISKSHMNNMIDILGSVTRDQALSLFKKSHFALIPSFYEGFGLIVAEAMSTGCIPITSNISVFRWILGDDASFLSVPTDNATIYAERIKLLTEDSSMFRTLQVRLRERQRSEFTPENTVQQYVNLITSIKNSTRIIPDTALKARKALPSFYRIKYSRIGNMLSSCKRHLLK